MKRISKKAIAIGFIVNAALSTICAAGPLSLFGVNLGTAKSMEVEQAAISAGAARQRQEGPVTYFDATGMKVPGMQTLKIFFYEEKFVLAQYSSEAATKEKPTMFNSYSAQQDESLRKILAIRYGQLVKTKDSGFGSSFTDQYVSDVEFQWSFDAGMKLKYKHPFMPSEPVTVTYYSSSMVTKVQADGDRANQDDVKQDAAKVGAKL